MSENDPFEGIDPYHYFGATGYGSGQYQASQGGQANPAWTTDPFGPSSNYGYNPSGDTPPAVNIQAYSPYPANSMAGGGDTPLPLYANVYGTNEFNSANPFSQGTSSASAQSVNNANNAFLAPTGALPGSPGYTGSSSGSSSAAASGGSGTAGVANPALGGTGATGTSGSGSGSPTPGGYDYQSFWNPEYAYNGWQRALADQGINTLSGTPAAQIASNDYYRAYGNWLLNAIAGNAPAHDVNQSFHDWAASGGNGGAGMGTTANFQTLMNGLHNKMNGTLAPNDPMTELVAGLENNPQLATQVFAAMGPRTAGSRYMPQYLQALASHNAVTGTNTVRNPLEALLMAFGAV